MYPFNNIQQVQSFLLCAAIATAYGCADQQTPWERIIKSGQLRFATVESPATCYPTASGYAGFECDLARRFAHELGVDLTLILARNPSAAMAMVKRDQADIGGADLASRMADTDLEYSPAFYQPDSRQVTFYKHLYPHLHVAFHPAGTKPVSWMYRHDDVLANRLAVFIRDQAESGELARLLEQYFGHMRTFDANTASTFLAMEKERLPLYEDLFRETAHRYSMDWTLLAAMSYQESHWHPDARSPTGVRGLMMLTQDTAAELGIDDRIDPPQSVDGGARYYHALLEKIPPRITDPDRTWFALAAYNIGFQHLEDARILTQELGGNPDRWRDVRKYLPLLDDDKWHVRTEYGKARGGEAVRYVGNIRLYEDLLRWTYPGLEKKEFVQPDMGEWLALGPVNLQAM